MAVRRNEPCPCGSGKRFKHCHGGLVEHFPIPREIVEAVRFVCFQTHLEEFQLATHGGTAFLIHYRGENYALTCHHVFRDFPYKDLVITDARMGKRAAGIRQICLPDNLRGDAEGSDIKDICIVKFHEIDNDFFQGVFDLDAMPAAMSEPANKLVVTGFLKEKSFINPPNIFASLTFLEFTDSGVTSDAAVRQGLATYAPQNIQSLSGLSGGPVYNRNKNAICGMTIRGGIKDDGSANIRFIDMYDIIHFVDAVTRNNTNVFYTKNPSIL